MSPQRRAQIKRPARKWIDLHTHSTFSDGSLSPSQLVAEAKRIGLAAVALTDHDTIGGLEEFLAAGPTHGIETLAGVEISLEFQKRTLHLLGYGIRADHAPLHKALADIVKGREERNDRMIRKLQMLGVRIELDEVKVFAGENIIARPHVAKALIQKGVVATFEEAFDRFLGRGRPAYCERYRLAPKAAIALIRDAGGLAVLAHPTYIGMSPDAFDAALVRFKREGLAGIEAYYTEFTDADTRFYLEMARRHELLVTGGTDFHGAIRPDVLLGRGRGNLRVPYELFQKLKDVLAA
ncbi:MAG: PHP domain-containing protein [Candidatus Sumerlaeia bacterium]|nr:PHP domain-containing protein [Candidatus Sumerlaeia bacterium]